MVSSSRFVIAVHILTLLAYEGDKPVHSDYLAGSVNTNPVVIRRILGMLSACGLVKSQPGAKGGSKLNRLPEEITLLEVYRAVETEGLYALHTQPPNENCLIGNRIQKALAGTLLRAEVAMEEVLAEMSVAEVLRTLLAL